MLVMSARTHRIATALSLYDGPRLALAERFSAMQ
jgi:hypothetical protein